MQLALTEAPNEALPVSCRPDFGVAWLTKDKFKVNETYDCWYISGTPTVKLYNDGFFSCQAKDPSLIEMMKRYLIFGRFVFGCFERYSENSTAAKPVKVWEERMKVSEYRFPKGYARYWRSEVIAGIVTGFSASIITISFIRTLQHMKSWLPQAINTVLIKRVCFLLVYFSVMGWLASHYWRRLSIPFIKAFNY
ncbi:hypothetical protein Godav_011998 [Gossypium davidsonii]|uniref:Uncharacterized protein n=1 Tax=Gossypium davidsonii TaxID=34287 RepID=A0A7J8RCP1_GOSDV|nr:hypothetical protein [Gossypium davidsonii]